MARVFLNEVYYFITVPTIEHKNFFDTDQKKQIILNKIINTTNKFKIQNYDFGINSNHYHILCFFHQGNIIPKFLNLINGASVFALNKLDNMEGRSVWDEYYIYYTGNDTVIDKIRGYVIGNPYKHEEVQNLNGLLDYKFSSFKRFAENRGISVAEDIVLSVIRLNEKDVLNNLTCLKAVGIRNPG